ncbi:hypothetical protein [Dankookia sp. P2]|uniref:hypothetical protein n=1 Tax=Dankookia sp. P2 TaxID=3423955 RepID=UPI003D66BB93
MRPRIARPAARRRPSFGEARLAPAAPPPDHRGEPGRLGSTQANRAPLTVRLDGSRVAVSAGAGGIGRALADRFVGCGARVFLRDIDRE